VQIRRVMTCHGHVRQTRHTEVGTAVRWPVTHNKGTSVALDGEATRMWRVEQKTLTPVNLDMVTVKYDVGGNELWVARYDGPRVE